MSAKAWFTRTRTNPNGSHFTYTYRVVERANGVRIEARRYDDSGRTTCVLTHDEDPDGTVFYVAETQREARAVFGAHR